MMSGSLTKFTERSKSGSDESVKLMIALLTIALEPEITV